MASVDEIKLGRSKAKTAVTTAARRLHGASHRRSDKDVLKDLMLELERAFGDFCSISEEYEAVVMESGLEAHRKVNGEDLHTYRESVTQTYDAAKDEYQRARRDHQEKEQQAAAGPIRYALMRDMTRLKECLNRVDTTLAAVTPDQRVLQCDREQLNPLLSVVLEEMDRLNTLQTPMQVQMEQHQVNELVRETDERKRLANLQMLSDSYSNQVSQSPVVASAALLAQPSHTGINPSGTDAPTTEQPVDEVGGGTAPHPAPVAWTGIPTNEGQVGAAISTPSASVALGSGTSLTSGSPAYVSSVSAAQTFIPVTCLATGVPASAPVYAPYPGWSPFHQPLATRPTHMGFSPGSAHSDIRLAKIALPTFSGLRKDWPEFRSVWRELAENSYENKKALAHELKKSVKGEASKRIKSVYITKPEAYDIMWSKLEDYYNDTSASVQAALEGLIQLKRVNSEDYRGLIALVDEVEASYSQLEELCELNALTMRDVDHINSLLPMHLRLEWVRRQRTLTQGERMRPFVPFMTYLDGERAAVMRMAETQPKRKDDYNHRGQDEGRRGFSVQQARGQSHHSEGNGQTKFYNCAFQAHRRSNIQHATVECKEFLRLPRNEQYEALKQVGACFRCFGNHRRSRCPVSKACSVCEKQGHHPLLCTARTVESTHRQTAAESHTVHSPTMALYPIHQVSVLGTGKAATVFCDGGSNTTYITHQAADRLRINKLKRFTLDVTTMGGVEKTYETFQYKIPLMTQAGRKVEITAFGMDRITGPVSKLDLKVIARLFPDYGPEALQRGSSSVDILLGCDYFGLHPKQELTKAGDHLSIMQGEFGICLQGAHPELKEDTRMDVNLAKTVHDIRLKSDSFNVQMRMYSHPEFDGGRRPKTFSVMKPAMSASGSVASTDDPVDMRESELSDGADASVQDEQMVIQSKPALSGNTAAAFLTLQGDTGSAPPAIGRDHALTAHTTQSAWRKDAEERMTDFIQGEELATETTPRCGACRCGKCPTVGQTYSFKEEQELKMIRENLEYDEVNARWITSYPWLVDPATLPDNYAVAWGTLRSTEQKLKRDVQWAATYKAQIQDMLDRKVARKLSKEEMRSWNGPKFYISHLAVVNSHSKSTPVRIVFNSSQVYKGISLNSCLAKGPDAYLNNLVGILLRWREEEIALVGDIRKMFNSIYLRPLEQHCHRFLWRELDQTKDPDVFVMERVNMGDTPAPAISSEAVYQTARRFGNDSPAAAELLRKSSYVDDLIDSFKDKPEALKVAKAAENMLAKGGFHVKCWQFTGDAGSRKGGNLDGEAAADKNEEHLRDMLKGSDGNLRVLGLGWRPEEDVIVFQVALNFSRKRRGVHIEPDLSKEDLLGCLPSVLTRRIVLEQVMRMYDPLGLVCPFTLWAKIYLRETWMKKLGWDDQLPDDMRDKWMNFFTLAFELEQLKLKRSLHPGDAVGRPWLIILSDGSDLAYGFAAYIRWQLRDGGYWCRLIMAKCRIAPINKLSTPQMELNAAVLSKRGRKVIEKETRFPYERVLQIVDSETVLNMVNKTSTRFKVYEGVRVGEIQAATNGDMTCWAWMAGRHNTADWLTRGRTPKDLNGDSDWWNGPAVLCQPVAKWGLKFGLQRGDPLPGEKKMFTTAATEASPSLIDYQRFGDVNKAIWVIARIRNVAKYKSLSGARGALVSPQDLRDAEDFLVRDVQGSIHEELIKRDRKGRTGGRYRRLNPVQNEKGFWVVGARLLQHNAMTLDTELQKLLPTCHRGTRLFMERAHRAGHRGRDATLARFRQQYWTPHGDKLAKSVKHHCQQCKLREAVLLKQEMAPLPEARLKPSPPFNKVMLDLFGPFLVRGEVQKRTSGKAYGVIFTDMVMRAVHIEVVSGYDTSSFLMALSRFASIRGWPDTIYSDPGSQLVGAERELREAWQRLDRHQMKRNGAAKGLTWVFGPADSPWHQGAVESLVKSTKRAIHFAVHNQRLSVPEFLTVCTEVANLLNERPIGVQSKEDSDITLFTPNSLLLGRATAQNPGGWQPYNESFKTRYHLVQVITDHFWKKWTELYVPTLMVNQKWNTASPDLCPGDVVMVADNNALRGEYRLGLIKEVHPGADGKVRRVSLTYKQYKVGEKVQTYSGAKDIVVVRSVQRLALLVPANYNPGSAEEELEKEIGKN